MTTDGAGPEPQESGKRRGCLARVVRLALVVYVLGLTFGVFLLGPLVDRAIRARLESSGSKWALHLRSIGWSGLELVDLRGGTDERVKVARVRVDYDPFELSRGLVRGLQVLGASWEVRWGPDGLDLGLPGSGEVGETAGTWESVPRIERLDLRASTLVLRREGEVWRIPLEGRMDWSPSGRLELELDLWLAGIPVRVRGTLPAPGTAGPVDLALTLDGRPFDIEGTLPQGVLAQLVGRIGAGENEPWRLEVGARLGALDGVLASRCVHLEDALLELRGELSDDGTPLSVEGAIRLGELWVDGRALRGVKLALTSSGERAHLECAARGDGWELLELGADLPADPRIWNAPTTMIPVLVRGRVDGPEPGTSAGFQLATGLAPQLSGSDGAGPWVRFEGTSLRLDPVPLRIPPPLDLPGLASGVLRAEGTLGSRGLEFVLTEGTYLELALEPGAHLRLQADEGRLAIDPRTGLRSLAIDLPRLDLTGSGPVNRIKKLEIAALDLAVPLTVRAASGRLAIGLAAEGRLAFESMTSSSASGAPLRAGPMSLNLAGDALVSAALGEPGGMSAEGRLVLTQIAAFEASSAELQVIGKSARVEAELGLDPGRPLQPALSAAIELERLGRLDGELALVGIVAEFPLPAGPFAAGAEREGTLEVDSIVWRGALFPGPRGQLRRDRGVLEFSGAWAPTARAAIALTGSLDADEGRVEVQAKGDVALERDDALERLLVAQVGVHFAGDIHLDASLCTDRDGERSGLLLAVDHAVLETLDGGQRLEGGVLGLELADLREPRSIGPAWVRWTGGKSGALALGAGEVRFSIESPSALLVLGSDIVTGQESTFWTQGFRLDPAAPATEVHIFCQGVSLEEWLRLATSDRAAGQGRLNGHVTLSIDLSRKPAVRLVGGRVTSLGKGSLQLDDAEVVGELLGRSMGAYALEGGLDLSKMVRERIVGALKEFAYESLAFDLLPEQGDITLQAACNGQGLRVPQQLDLSVRFKGFGSLLALLLDLDKRAGR